MEPNIALKMMLYTYCSVFHINPIEAHETPLNVIIEMLQIHGEVKKLESDELSKAKRGVK